MRIPIPSLLLYARGRFQSSDFSETTVPSENVKIIENRNHATIRAVPLRLLPAATTAAGEHCHIHIFAHTEGRQTDCSGSDRAANVIHRGAGCVWGEAGLNARRRCQLFIKPGGDDGANLMGEWA